MDKDLEQLEAEIRAKDSGLPLITVTPSQPPINFYPQEQSQTIDLNSVKSETASDRAGKAVGVIFDQAIAATVQNDEGVQKKMLATAKKVIENKTDVIEDETDLEVQRSAYNLNREACNNYGIKEDVSKWKIVLMKFGSGFWFVIYFIIATLTIAPITVFFKGIQGAIKQIWLAILLAIVFYLIIAVGIPLLTTLLI